MTDAITINALRADGSPDPNRAHAELRFEVTSDGVELNIRWGFPESRDRGTYFIFAAEALELMEMLEQLTEPARV